MSYNQVVVYGSDSEASASGSPASAKSADGRRADDKNVPGSAHKRPRTGVSPGPAVSHSPDPQPSSSLVNLDADGISAVFNGPLPALFDDSLRVTVTRSSLAPFHVMIDVDAPAATDDAPRVVVMRLKLDRRRVLTVSEFFVVADHAVVDQLRSRVAAGRTLAGVGMEWVRSVALQARATRVTLVDEWQDYAEFDGTTAPAAVAEELVGPDNKDRTVEMSSLVRKAQRFNGETVDSFADLTAADVAYLRRVRDDGYYGGFGMKISSAYGLNRTLSVKPTAMLVLRGGFLDLAA